MCKFFIAFFIPISTSVWVGKKRKVGCAGKFWLGLPKLAWTFPYHLSFEISNLIWLVLILLLETYTYESVMLMLINFYCSYYHELLLEFFILWDLNIVYLPMFSRRFYLNVIFMFISIFIVYIYFCCNSKFPDQMKWLFQYICQCNINVDFFFYF